MKCLNFMEKKLSNYIAQGGQGLFEVETRFRQVDGTWGWVLSKGKAVSWDPGGAPESIIGLAVNIQTISPPFFTQIYCIQTKIIQGS